MQRAIRENFQWDISEWVSSVVDHIADEFLKWAKTYRSDLHKVVSTYEGKRWLKTNIKNMMKSLK